MNATDMWQEWKRAVARNQPVSAKSHATALLDLLSCGVDDEPSWTSEDRRRFFIWCEREALLIGR